MATELASQYIHTCTYKIFITFVILSVSDFLSLILFTPIVLRSGSDKVREKSSGFADQTVKTCTSYSRKPGVVGERRKRSATKEENPHIRRMYAHQAGAWWNAPALLWVPTAPDIPSRWLRGTGRTSCICALTRGWFSRRRVNAVRGGGKRKMATPSESGHCPQSAYI